MGSAGQNQMDYNMLHIFSKAKYLEPRADEGGGMVSPKVFSSKAPQLFYEMLVMCCT